MNMDFARVIFTPSAVTCPYLELVMEPHLVVSLLDCWWYCILNPSELISDWWSYLSIFYMTDVWKHPTSRWFNQWPDLVPWSLEITYQHRHWLRVTCSLTHPKKGHENTELPRFVFLSIPHKSIIFPLLKNITKNIRKQHKAAHETINLYNSTSHHRCGCFQK